MQMANVYLILIYILWASSYYEKKGKIKMN